MKATSVRDRINEEANLLKCNTTQLRSIVVVVAVAFLVLVLVILLVAAAGLVSSALMI